MLACTSVHSLSLSSLTYSDHITVDNNHSESDLLWVHFISYELASPLVCYMVSWTWTFKKSNWSVTIIVWQWPPKLRVKSSKNSRDLLLPYVVFSQKTLMDSPNSLWVQGHLHSLQHSFRKIGSSWQPLLIICLHLLLNLWTLMTQKMLSQPGIPSCRVVKRNMLKPPVGQYRHLPLFIHLYKIQSQPPPPPAAQNAQNPSSCCIEDSLKPSTFSLDMTPAELWHWLEKTGSVGNHYRPLIWTKPWLDELRIITTNCSLESNM